MKFSWTIELFGYALRDSNNRPRAILTRHPKTNLYACQILESGLPSSGPYKQQTKAAEWGQKTLLRMGVIPADSSFRVFPYERGRR